MIKAGGAPRLHAPLHSRRMALQTVAALLPAVLAIALWQGMGMLVNLLLACLFGIGIDLLLGRLRGLAVSVSRIDAQGLLPALLLGLLLPPGSHWSLLLAGLLFGMGIVRHGFGMPGASAFHPAMAGLLFLAILFPESRFADGPAWTVSPSLDLGDPGLWITLLLLAGGVFLCQRRAIAWRIPASLLAVYLGLALTPALRSGDLASAAAVPAPALLLLAFFIATDHGSSPVTRRGQYRYGLLLGLLVFLLSDSGAAISAAALAAAVVFANFFGPLLDGSVATRPAASNSARPADTRAADVVLRGEAVR